MGGGTTVTTASQPSMESAEAIREWVKSLPEVYTQQLKYQPLQAQQQVELAQQYAQPFGESLLAAQRAMYPQEYALREQLGQVAQQGMMGGVPEWQRQEYLSGLRGQLGEQAISGIGADYISRGLMQQQEDWRRYYQQMSLGLSGGQPTYQAQVPITTDYMSGFTPSSVLGYYSGYGTQTQTTPYSPFQWMGGFGNLLTGIGSLGQWRT